MPQVRVRFAPSPTGSLHIGGARTAIFNWLFARSRGGIFVLRIEDTDRLRSEQKYVDDILNALRWLGLEWDEGPYFQSERQDLYHKRAKELVDAGAAYQAEPLENGGGRAVLLKKREDAVTVLDMLRGPVSFDHTVFKDEVLIKSDGSPAYNFACVVDDADMGITHVLRGDDHLSNTPKQLMMYKALGLEPPQFVHMPMIHGEDGKKLSKRHGALPVTEYRDMGFLPEALANYLLLLGWSPGDDREKISLYEAAQCFDIQGLKKGAPVFSSEKALWLNGVYIRALNQEKIAKELADRYPDDPVWRSNEKEKIAAYIELFRERCKTLADFKLHVHYIFWDEFQVDPDAAQKYLNEDTGVLARMTDILSLLEALTEFTPQALEAIIREYVQEKGLKARDVIHPLRVIVTGRSATPGLFDVFALIGKERVIGRLAAYVRGSI